MEKKVIKLINVQKNALSDEDFDLEAWKSGVIATLSRFLGEGDVRINQIADLKIDYSSWALRDSNSKYNPIESCKKKGVAILDSIIAELEIVGLEREASGSDLFDKLSEALTQKEVKMLQDQTTRKKTLASLKKEKLVQITGLLLEQ